MNRPRSRVERSDDLGLTFQCPPQKGFRGKIARCFVSSDRLSSIVLNFLLKSPRARALRSAIVVVISQWKTSQHLITGNGGSRLEFKTNSRDRSDTRYGFTLYLVLPVNLYFYYVNRNYPLRNRYHQSVMMDVNEFFRFDRSPIFLLCKIVFSSLFVPDLIRCVKLF